LLDGVLLQRTLYHGDEACYVFFGLIIACYIFFILAHLLKNSSQREWSGVSLRIANLLLVFLSGVAFLPISSAFGSQLSCGHFDSNGEIIPYDKCWQGDFNLDASIGIGGFLLLLILTFVKDLFLIETVPFDNAILSKAHGRIDTLEHLTFMIILFVRN
jgi:hypothetical protein